MYLGKYNNIHILRRTSEQLLLTRSIVTHFSTVFRTHDDRTYALYANACKPRTHSPVDDGCPPFSLEPKRRHNKIMVIITITIFNAYVRPTDLCNRYILFLEKVQKKKTIFRSTGACFYVYTRFAIVR